MCLIPALAPLHKDSLVDYAEIDMNPDKLPSLASTMAALDRFADELMQEEGLYRITSYGWADQDTIDPEFSGHALWQTEPPFEPDWERIFDGGVPRWTPLPRVEQLMLNGEDFLGAMLIARRFAGIALCADRNTDPASIDDEQF